MEDQQVIRQKEDPKQKMAEIAEGNKLRKQQNKIKNRYNYLSKMDPRDRFFPYEFVKAQAKEAVRYLQELKQYPFHNFRIAIERMMAEDAVLRHCMYVKHNEFNELIVDEERLKTLILPEEQSEDEKEHKSNK